MKLTSPRLRSTTTTTTAGSSHAQRRSTVAFVQHTGPCLSACRSSALKAPRTRQQVGALGSGSSSFFLLRCLLSVCRGSQVEIIHFRYRELVYIYGNYFKSHSEASCVSI